MNTARPTDNTNPGDKTSRVLFPSVDAGADAVLAVMRSTSPHLDRLSSLFKTLTPRIMAGEAERIISEAEAQFLAVISKSRDEARIMSAARHFRMTVNHVVAVTDFLNLAGIDTHLNWLSQTAVVATEGVARWICQQSSLGDKANDGWFILALGKLGSGELNYSSDIDLIVITLPHLMDDEDQDSAEYIRMTRRLVSMLSKPTADGIGWRVDLRLRPDPGATPVAIRSDAALSYYESMARTWERAAFIRSRVIAGNRDEGEAFLKSIQPFVWRRYLDFNVLEDMRIMLRREQRSDNLLGYHIKNGLGGIRSVEFFVHVHQLIAGGREPALRLGPTADALTALAENGWIGQAESKRLITAYKTWRRLEHRLQMIGDAQTHQLPRAEEQMQSMAGFCGHDDVDDFRRAIIALSDQVIKDTSGLMEKIGPSHHNDDEALCSWLQGHETDPDAITATLGEMGFQEPGNMIPLCEGWMAGRIAVTRSDRARSIMVRLLPQLFRQFARHDNPDASFSHFARLLERLPAGVHLLTMLESSTALAEMIITVFDTAPRLADELVRHPEVVDSLMYTSFWDVHHDWQDRQQQLTTALDNGIDYEDRLNILRRFQREWEFQTATHLMTGTITAAEAGSVFSRIADTVISAIIPEVNRQMENRFGRMDDGGITVLAMGRLGAEEMTMTSDIDLIFIYECDDDSQSTGKKPLSGPIWYSRFSQQLINALTAPTAEGRCYEVDMRLRPSGNAGPVAIHVDGFARYQAEEAWLWEHMALLKARPITGFRQNTLPETINRVIDTALQKDRKPADIIKDVTAMRQRVRAAFPALSPHDLRYRDGGLLDLGYLVQMLQMMPGAKDLPRAARAADAIPDLVACGLLDVEEARLLAVSAEKMNNLQHWLRLTGMKPDDGSKLPKAIQDAFGLGDLNDLVAWVEQLAAPVKAALEKRIGPERQRQAGPKG